MPIRPLTAEEKRKKEQVVDAYSDFWNNIRFRKGWATPLFKREEVLHLLQRAAEIVVRKRSELDERNPGFTMRMLDGSAREFLWGVTEHPVDPSDSLRSKEEAFVHDLVHATFKDAKGYVEDLTADELNQFILSVSHLLDEELPVVSRIHQMLCRLKTIIHAVDDLPESLLKQCVLENDSAHAQLERFAEDLSTAESSAISFFRLMNESVDQEKSRIEAEPAVEESPELTSEEDLSAEDEVAQTSEALRQSTSTLPVEYVEEEEGSESESPDESNKPIDAEPAVEEASPEATSSVAEELEQPTPEDQAETQDAEEKRKQEDEEERKRKEEEERAEKERRRQEEREQMRREAQMRQRLREQAEAKSKKAEEEKNKSEHETIRMQRWKQLELEPRFDVQEKTDGYLITATLPHLRSEDLKVKLDDRANTLTISGVCVPTPEEEEQMLEEVQHQLLRRYGRGYERVIDSRKLDTLLLRYGADRFGSFSQEYTLPEGTQFDQVSCSFENQCLRCAVPVRRSRQNAQRGRGRQPTYGMDPYFGSPYGRYGAGYRQPGFGGFW